MRQERFEGDEKVEVAWCPGCGNFKILGLLKKVLRELDLSPGKLVITSGIGQAAKMPHYLRTNVFNGLHGRALPAATGIKLANPGLTVIAESGDGCMYGEGGNHFVHAIRRNPDITVLVHNNMVYGLTKGQASPTSSIGFVTPIQTKGVAAEPFNPLAVAVALDAPFVARAFCGDEQGCLKVLRAALLHRGFSLVDILQPCVSYNKVNTYEWFEKHSYHVEKGYDPKDRVSAFAKTIEKDPLPVGVLYVGRRRETLEESCGIYLKRTTPLYRRGPRFAALSSFLREKRAT